MFQSLKLFVEQHINVEEILSSLTALSYRNAPSVVQEGDFSRRGEVLDIFPANFDSPVRIALDDDRIRTISSFNLATGKAIWEHKIVLILAAKPPKEKSFSSDIPLNPFIDIQEGDYVVHHQHGVGKFLGIKPMLVQGRDKDHLVIEYQGGDRLFVPRHDLHLVQKYVSFHKKPPRLFKLGSKEWLKIKNHIQKKLERLAAELLHVQAMRASLKGHAFSADAPWQKEFEDAFPFEETPDQIKSTQEVKADMESEQPMDRLLCGDVGYGKTEVALRAAFKAVMDNKQVAVLVPTTILAEQHHYNFSQRMKNFPVRVEMLSRFRTKHEQATILKGLASGEVDIVIGTHRLISKDIAFKDLGLIVIDEEQRFGVKAKERLKHMKLLVDVLTMTATPIPRTLYMSISGAKDMSVISTPPQKRVPVDTHIVAFDEDLIRETVRRELGRKGQVFFLHNRVEDIDRIAKIVQRLAPQARTAIGHGQMPSRLLEEIMLKFLKGEIDILICTTIIESGIDVPNANTLIINRADRFGLSELHQLRGRVGRFTQQAYAYFIVPDPRAMTHEAKLRLKALQKYSELGAGFQIAFEDLQIRGAGNLLGEEQSGYIAAVGFDLYCRLLKESIGHLKKTKGVKIS
ncbi:MAG: transcription-repair coupling factor [Candidatus Omnitrophota bacterium]|nr:transcription-repair coupling factor [Candidatus Omnitrophota bacterium]MDZ4243155.1 transcription-repair coupling factor [Candidatus Omnitrophota bacterium]